MKQIVVVDQSEEVRETLSRTLTAAGHRVWEAKSGREALRICHRAQVDVAFTGIFMPSPDGFDLILQLLSINPRPKLIALSEGDRFVSSAALAMAERLGVDRVLTKPYSDEAILRILDEVQV